MMGDTVYAKAFNEPALQSAKKAFSKPRLLDQVRDVIRCKHYSIRTEQTYLEWIKRFIYFNNRKHPKDLGTTHISAFLTHLAVQRKVAGSTQNQALCALVFLYKEIIKKDIGQLDDLIRAKRLLKKGASRCRRSAPISTLPASAPTCRSASSG